MTGRWRAACLVLGLPLLAGCALSSNPAPSPSPSPTSGVQAIQTPAAAPSVTAVATLTEGSCKCYTLRLISLGGTLLALATLAPGVLSPLAGGENGVYYVLGDTLMELSTNGSSATVGTVATAPSGSGSSIAAQPEFGSLAVSPAATEWGYLQAYSSGGAQTDQLWLGETNQNPRLLLTSVQSAGATSTEFPNGWSYQLLGWASGSLVLAQLPAGSDSFVSSALEVSLVNPQTGAETLLSNSQNCPVSAVSPSGEYACFQEGGGQATELSTGTAGISAAAWSLAPGDSYGKAVFSPSGTEIAFASCAGCTATPSSAYLGSQVEVLDQSTGSIQPIGAPGLVPDAWLPDGDLVATRYSAGYGTASGPLSEVVLLNPASGQATPITDNTTSQFLGLATS